MGVAEMDHVAELLARAIRDRADVRAEVGALRDRFPRVRYGFEREDLDA
jgi:hypothetical protein